MKLSDIDLRLLRVFRAVAEAGGFARAQSTLGISQPAISTQIAKLEDRLGLRLCERGPQGFSLTSEGQAVLHEATLLLAQVDEAAERLRDIGRRPVGQIRFGMVDCMVTDRNNPLVSHLRALRIAYPHLEAQIGIYDFLDCLTELQAGRLDIALVGIGAGENIPADLEARKLYEETSGLYCSPDHPCSGIDDPDTLKIALAEANISAHSFVLNPIDRAFDPALLDHGSGIAQDTIESTLYLTLAGSHVGLIPHHYADGWVRSGDLLSIAPQVYSVISQFHALRTRAPTHDPITEAAWNMGAVAGC